MPYAKSVGVSMTSNKKCAFSNTLPGHINKANSLRSKTLILIIICFSKLPSFYVIMLVRGLKSPSILNGLTGDPGISS